MDNNDISFGTSCFNTKAKYTLNTYINSMTIIQF